MITTNQCDLNQSMCYFLPLSNNFFSSLFQRLDDYCIKLSYSSKNEYINILFTHSRLTCIFLLIRKKKKS